MLYNQNNLNCVVIASKSEMRPEIAGVFFKSDRTVAKNKYLFLFLYGNKKRHLFASFAC